MVCPPFLQELKLTSVINRDSNHISDCGFLHNRTPRCGHCSYGGSP